MKARFEAKEDGFDLLLGDRVILRHHIDAPAFRIAQGNPSITMVRGNFRHDDTPTDERVLRYIVPPPMNTSHVFLSDKEGGEPLLDIWFPDDLPILKVQTQGAHDRISVDWAVAPDEIVWGGGEQMSYLALNGRKFPMWTSEPGVGREPGTELTDKVSSDGSFAGGDYWTTNYPQPTMLFSGGHAVHLENACYSELDITLPGIARTNVWEWQRGFPALRRRDAGRSGHWVIFSRSGATADSAAAARLGHRWCDSRLEGWCEQFRASGKNHCRRGSCIRPVVRGLGGYPPDQLRSAIVLGLAMERQTLP